MPQPKHLTPLGHRIDFEALITVDSANPNGDPMKKGLPRTDSSGRGVISAVCIRRKLRNALAELGQPILISPPERPGDDLARRLSALPGNCDIPAEACRRWFDVRAFGQVFSSRGMHAPGVKGAVSIQPAVSVCPVKVISTGITCCLPNNGKISMGFKSSVEHGLYILRGSIIPNCFGRLCCIFRITTAHRRAPPGLSRFAACTGGSTRGSSASALRRRCSAA